MKSITPEREEEIRKQLSASFQPHEIGEALRRHEQSVKDSAELLRYAKEIMGCRDPVVSLIMAAFDEIESNSSGAERLAHLLGIVAILELKLKQTMKGE